MGRRPPGSGSRRPTVVSEGPQSGAGRSRRPGSAELVCRIASRVSAVSKVTDRDIAEANSAADRVDAPHTVRVATTVGRGRDGSVDDVDTD